METFLYNLNTQKREGEIRNGRYLVDGKPGVLPDFLVELEIERRSSPTYDSSTETLEHTSYADLNNLKWIEEDYIRNLTQEEIEQRLPKAPDSCTPRQLRIALIKNGISLSIVENYINNIQDNEQKEIALAEWEYALDIKKDHPLLLAIAENLNLDQKRIDEIFTLAVTL
jgi:hypothetical protein